MLTRKKELFCKHYLSNGFRGGEAAMAAGYRSAKRNYLSTKASKLLQEEEVKAYIDKYKKKVDDELDEKIKITQSELIEYLSNCVRGTEEEEVIVTMKECYQKDRIQIKQADRLKAAQMLFKYYSLDDASKKDDEESNKIIINNDITPQPEEPEIEPISEEIEEIEETEEAKNE